MNGPLEWPKMEGLCPGVNYEADVPAAATYAVVRGSNDMFKKIFVYSLREVETMRHVSPRV